jgi:DNA-directed RNA polymerase subunit omega
MNPLLVKQASELITNPHVLINLVSRRVRQLTSGGGGVSRSLLANGNLSAADTALTELIEGKMGYDLPDAIPVTRQSGKGRNRPKNWASISPPTRNGH